MDTSDERHPAPNGTAPGARREASPPLAKRPSSRSHSPYRDSRDRSPSPFSTRKAPRRSRSPREARNGGRRRGSPSGMARNRFEEYPSAPPVQAAPPPAPRERSLSPYSKRLALTKAMHNG